MKQKSTVQWTVEVLPEMNTLKKSKIRIGIMWEAACLHRFNNSYEIYSLSSEPYVKQLKSSFKILPKLAEMAKYHLNGWKGM